MRCNAETLRVKANVFENGGKVRFQMSSDTCGQGLSVLLPVSFKNRKKLAQVMQKENIQ